MDFDSMTVPQLKDIARANNLKNWSKLKKADLIQFLIDNVPGGARGGRPPQADLGPRHPGPGVDRRARAGAQDGGRPRD